MDAESTSAEDQADETAEVPAAPVPDVSGTFAMFTLPNGGMVLSWWTEQYGPGQTEVPAMIVRQAMAMAGGKGGPLGMLGKLGAKLGGRHG